MGWRGGGGMTTHAVGPPLVGRQLQAKPPPVSPSGTSLSNQEPCTATCSATPTATTSSLTSLDTPAKTWSPPTPRHGSASTGARSAPTSGLELPKGSVTAAEPARSRAAPPGGRSVERAECAAIVATAPRGRQLVEAPRRGHRHLRGGGTPLFRHGHSAQVGLV